MKLYQKTFVNPLLAIAFKDGIEFINDPDYKAMDPKEEGLNKWTVLIEYNGDDDDDEENDTVIHSSSDKFDANRYFDNQVKPKLKTLRDYENHLNKMKPRSIGKQAETIAEVIHPPVKITHEDLPEACGECVHCATGHDCLRVINAALGQDYLANMM